mgnify:CR=1 FL=1
MRYYRTIHDSLESKGLGFSPNRIENSVRTEPFEHVLSAMSIGVVVEVLNDEVKCELPGRGLSDPSEEAMLGFWVAMPFRLQRSRFHNKTVVRHDGTRIKYVYSTTEKQQRTATIINDNGTEGTSETQVIVPAYNPRRTESDEVIADDEGETHGYSGDLILFGRVSGPTGSLFTQYIDMTPGREWAKKTGT